MSAFDPVQSPPLLHLNPLLSPSMNKISLLSILFIIQSYTPLAATALSSAASTNSTNVRPASEERTWCNKENDDSDDDDFGNDNEQNNLPPIITPLPKESKKSSRKKTKKKRSKAKKTKGKPVTEKEIEDTVESIQCLFQNRVDFVNDIIKSEGGLFGLKKKFHNKTIDKFVREYAVQKVELSSGGMLKKRMKNNIGCCNKVLWGFWELIFKKINEKETREQHKINIIIALLKMDEIRCTDEVHGQYGRLVSSRFTRHPSLVHSLRKTFPKKKEIIKELWDKYVHTNDKITKKAKEKGEKGTTGVRYEKNNNLIDFINKLEALLSKGGSLSGDKNKEATHIPSPASNSIIHHIASFPEEDTEDDDIVLHPTPEKEERKRDQAVVEDKEIDFSTHATQPPKKKQRLISNDNSHLNNELSISSHDVLPPPVDLMTNSLSKRRALNPAINHVLNKEQEQTDTLNSLMHENDQLENHYKELSNRLHCLMEDSQYNYSADNEIEISPTEQIPPPSSFIAIHHQDTPTNYAWDKEQEQRDSLSELMEENYQLKKRYNQLSNYLHSHTQYNASPQANNSLSTVTNNQFSSLG